MVWRCSWKNNNTILWRNTSKFMEVLAESSLIIKIKNKNVLKWLTYYVHRKLLRGRGSSKYYHGYIEGGWGYKGPKNVLRSMWLIPYEYCNDRISTLQIPIYCPCVLDYCQYDVRTIQTQNICLSISEILVKLL